MVGELQATVDHAGRPAVDVAMTLGGRIYWEPCLLLEASWRSKRQ